MWLNIFELDLESLEIDNIGSWPLVVRLACIGLTCFVTCVGFYYIDLDAQWHEYQHLQSLREEQKMLFIEKQSQVVHLDIYKEQMKTVKEKFEILKCQLPARKEEAEFLEAISQQASAAGLVFVSIKPSPPEQRTFYNEHTLELKLSGPYHGIGKFIGELSKMPRMITVHDASLKLDQTEKLWTGKINLSVIIKTYWMNKQAQ